MLEVAAKEGYIDIAKILLENKVEPTPLSVKVYIYIYFFFHYKCFYLIFFFFFNIKINNQFQYMDRLIIMLK